MAMIVETRRPEGRPKRSSVWNHFTYDQKSNESVCTIRNEERECGARVKGKNPTNLKQHLKCHKDEYRMVIDEEKARRVETNETSIAKSKSRQAAAITSMLHVQTLSKDSIRYKDITRKLALFIGTANVPYSLVENLEFRDLLLELQPCYLPPGRGPIKKK
uniref:BED-type domain-containing protein n=1 Tax=Amphimedon queenslandica TaxID=400682 RepID=A0A1X7VI67_AMPQE